MVAPIIEVRASCPPVHVRLEHYADERRSRDYGPYEYVWVMYGVLRGILLQDPRTEEVIAEFVQEAGLWCGQDRKTYSDMIIFSPMTILPSPAREDSETEAPDVCVTGMCVNNATCPRQLHCRRHACDCPDN